MSKVAQYVVKGLRHVTRREYIRRVSKRALYQMRMQDQRRGSLTTAAFQVWLVGSQIQARMVYPWTASKHRAMCRLMTWG